MEAQTRQARFRIGDRIRWAHATSDHNKGDVAGLVMAVIPSDFGLDAFTMYDVKFDFGTFTLYGTQIEPAKKATQIRQLLNTAMPAGNVDGLFSLLIDVPEV